MGVKSMVMGMANAMSFKRLAVLAPFFSDLLTWHKGVSSNDFAESIESLPAKFLPRVASFNGTDEFIFKNSVNFNNAKNPLTFVIEFISEDITASQGLLGSSSATTDIVLRLLGSKAVIKIGGILVTTTTVLSSNTHYVIGVVRRTATAWDFYIDGLFIETITGGDENALMTDFKVGSFDNGHYFKGVIMRASYYEKALSSTEMVNYANGESISGAEIDYQLSGQGDYEYDLVNANHGTWAGTGDRYTYDLEGSNYPNENGYSLWEHATSDPIQVPFDIDGNALSLTPGTNIPTGYTKTRDVLAGGNKWNMQDALIDFDPDDGTDSALDMFDRSNATIQTATSRAADNYDAVNPYRYHVDEIADPRIYDTYFEAAYKDRVFGKVVLDGTDLIRYDEELNYGTVKAGADLVTVQEYCGIDSIYP